MRAARLVGGCKTQCLDVLLDALVGSGPLRTRRSGREMKLADRTRVARRVVNLIEKRNESLINLRSRAGLKLMR